jgi:ectoine hydroxylase-related dioxygenase (phytanoyl-CoA dioxygenase family)
VTTFLTHASGDDLAGLWLLLLTTGLRRAEALGLAWSNVGAVAVPVRAGSVVVFSSLTPHATGYNVTDEERKAYILQYAPEGAVARRGDPAGPPGPPQPQNDAERQFLVARGGEPIETSIT